MTRYEVVHKYLTDFAAGYRFYATGVSVMTPSATLANGWLAGFRRHYEKAPDHIVQMWQHDGPGDWRYPAKNPVRLYETPGAQ